MFRWFDGIERIGNGARSMANTMALEILQVHATSTNSWLSAMDVSNWYRIKFLDSNKWAPKQLKTECSRGFLLFLVSFERIFSTKLELSRWLRRRNNQTCFSHSKYLIKAKSRPKSKPTVCFDMVVLIFESLKVTVFVRFLSISNSL